MTASNAVAGESRSGPSPGGPRNALIRRLGHFAALSTDEQALLLHHCAQARTYPAQADLVREGESPDGILVVLEGFACRQQYRNNGARQITAYLLPGDLCDWDPALGGRLDDAVSTLSPCRAARIPREALLREALGPHSGLERALRMSHLTDESTLREWVVNIGCRSAVERIAHLFCELHVRLTAVGLAAETGFDFPLTQNDLAVTVGLSDVHVNRSLQALRRERLIALKSRHLTILDWDALVDLAEFNPAYLRFGRFPVS
ncbi:Crp/Fnr family transcriptional regulator [Methylobacterium sp. J-068]|uniref:Crp/Fnr family transcriptional regulator n=1 Tax=Methylobacterium sp. J-068 TaxID=2836649 RepID=UPI001FB8A95B|nr:Crp/Fnr family transcriptional regulator [Methylobacterium sp. J-068]MCJ2037311.1 Crp/Fnr family transcriptional regulator [Methylobacterium sp. J-068]